MIPKHIIASMLGGPEIAILIVTFLFIGLFIAVVLLIKSLIRKNVFAKNEGQQKEVAKMKLDAVRSQLNPHFMFNALAGIQNLMNKNDIENANRYLGKFARLTRNVLEAKEQISISEEIGLLNDYLQMEQLRFKFHYQINTEDHLDIENLEIPSMLLQPFAENAVKHGINELKDNGSVNINFTSRGNDLILSIADNGPGFSSNLKSEGHGIQLMKNRINLYNSISKQTKMMMNIQSGNQGTLITIMLTNWL
ncbi:sensor histidine kinase [Pedobacter sp. GR22-6]|uniref:sensor histidine kinase n=1 Tax=Pedobacter sp. GR22-6 TaxID=3127957 RepID=UPI00307F5CD2